MFFFAKLSETHYKLQRNTCLTYFKKTLKSEPCVSYMRKVLAGQRLLSHRRGSKDHSSLVTAIFRWFRSGETVVMLDFLLWVCPHRPFSHLNISVPTSVHASRSDGTEVLRLLCLPRCHDEFRAPRRKLPPALTSSHREVPVQLPQRCGAARFVVKLPVLFERKCTSTKVRRIKSPLPNPFYIQFCKGRKALVPEDARGPRARQGGDGFCWHWKVQKQRMIWMIKSKFGSLLEVWIILCFSLQGLGLHFALTRQVWTWISIARWRSRCRVCTGDQDIV